MTLDTWDSILTIVSMALGVIVAVIVVATLVQTMVILGRVRGTAERLATGLEAAVGNTSSLPDHIPTINGALTALEGGLAGVDVHLVGAARAYGVAR